MVLSTHQLSIGYKKSGSVFVVQQAINIELMAGEVVCLIGPNGCGKSTLLRTLGGLQKPLSGTILINGKKFQELSVAEKSLQMALVLTEQVSIGRMTVFEMVMLGRYPHTNWLGNLSEKDRHVIEESIAQVHLSHKTNELFYELSDGEKQRVMIAKALAQDTSIVLLDEPTAHLDLPNRVEIMLLLRKLAKETGKSILLSTHELDLALQASDNIWLMQKEGIICGLPEELVINGNLQTVFQNRSFTFDERTGNFIMNYPIGKTIALQGDEVLCYWIRRMLWREGFTVETEAATMITAVSKGNYTIQKHGADAVRFSSLPELATFLRNNFA